MWSFGLTIATTVYLLPSPAPAQSTAQYSPLLHAAGVPSVACGTPALFARQLLSGFAPPSSTRMASAETPDGRPLWYDQNPRLLHAEHTGGLALDDFLVVGDVETLAFGRWSNAASANVQEIWQRVRTTAIDGRLISVFSPRWDDAELWDAIGENMRGFDFPYVYFGSVTMPSLDRSDNEAFEILLSWAPRNVPPAKITRVDAHTQYASHVVNLVIPDFGSGRLSAGDFGYDLVDAAKRFYRYFKDEYDSIAFISRQLQLVPYPAFHRNVRNPIAGLGDLPLFDNSRSYGSASVLRSVEFYPSARFAATSTSTHQIGHQWVDYWDWSAVSGNVERAGLQPESHTPLLYPGEVYTGAVLGVTRRVAAVDNGAAYVIERTPSPALHHPTTLYRMGLIEPEAVPELLVFERQGQFDAENAATPAVGTSVEGGVRAVHINDIMAEHGVRTGPVDQTWSRVTVVVSRDGLLTADEMSYWNFVAARHAATEGVTSWHGAPSFFEATGRRVALRTDVTPISHVKIAADFEVSHVSIDPREFRGVRLDDPVPAAIAAGETVIIAGTVTATDRDDFDAACITWMRYGASADERRFECGAIYGDRFWLPYTFTEADVGNYALQVFLFFPDPDAEPQPARSVVSGISVMEFERLHAAVAVDVAQPLEALQAPTSPLEPGSSAPTPVVTGFLLENTEVHDGQQAHGSPSAPPAG